MADVSSPASAAAAKEAKMNGAAAETNGCWPIVSTVSYEPGELPIEGRLFINGEFRSAKSGKTWENMNPFTEKTLSIVHEAGEEDIDDAVKAADAAFQKWKKVDAQSRAKLLLRILDLVEKHKQQIAELEAMDSGKPLKSALVCDLKIALDVIRYCAGAADRINGATFNHQSVQLEGGNAKHFSYTRKDAIGVCGQLIPWNFPFLMAVWKIIPVIAAGCTTVIKSSERTPLTLMSFAALLNEAGVPPGVVNCVSGGPPTGEMIVKHPLVKKVALTGSIQAGKRVAALAAEFGLKRVSLELGGKSPMIVFDDADLEDALRTAHDGFCFNMGEVCIASGRVYVHEKIFDDFATKLVASASTETCGDPMNLETTMGPLIDQNHFDSVKAHVKKAQSEGATIAVGGDAVLEDQLFFKPTVVRDVEEHMAIAKEEVFGPVVALMKFKDEEEVIRRANDTHTGLAAGVFTKDVSRAHRVAHALEAGSVYINGWGATDAGAPFGGFKSSGWGRELGPQCLDLYLETKTIVVSLE